MSVQQPDVFRNIEQLRQFEPGRTYLWDLRFSFKPFKSANNSFLGVGGKIPSSVTAWIPAESLTETIAVLNSSDITVGQQGFRFASGSSPKEITINFIDDYTGKILEWLKSWIDDVILCKGQGINFMSEYVDILTIDDLSPMKTILKSRRYVVYPDGPITNPYTSDSGIKVYSVNFVVVGSL